MAKSLIPKSKARTAYGLLSEISALVLAEPKRLNMSRFLLQGDDARLSFNPEKIPACGTIGCICGWATVLAGTKDDVRMQIQCAGQLYYGEYPGARILGLDNDQATKLFTDEGIKGTPGTVVHARSVVSRIRRFQKSNRSQLLAQKL